MKTPLQNTTEISGRLNSTKCRCLGLQAGTKEIAEAVESNQFFVGFDFLNSGTPFHSFYFSAHKFSVVYLRQRTMYHVVNCHLVNYA